MDKRFLSGRFEPPVERTNYRLTGRLDALLQHRVADHRLFLALRNAGYSSGFRPVVGGVGRDELRGEPMGDEGSESGCCD